MISYILWLIYKLILQILTSCRGAVISLQKRKHTHTFTRTLFNNILVEEATVQCLLKTRSHPLNTKTQMRSAYQLLQQSQAD